MSVWQWIYSNQRCRIWPLLLPRNADGVTVFDYRYSLPVYLDAVSIFLAVLGGLDPHFPGDQTAELQGVAGVTCPGFLIHS